MSVDLYQTFNSECEVIELADMDKETEDDAEEKLKDTKEELFFSDELFTDLRFNSAQYFHVDNYQSVYLKMIVPPPEG